MPKLITIDADFWLCRHILPVPDYGAQFDLFCNALKHLSTVGIRHVFLSEEHHCILDRRVMHRVRHAGVSRLVNVDYHSDMIDYNNTFSTPTDGSWVNFIRLQAPKLMSYMWVRRSDSRGTDQGECHSTINPFEAVGNEGRAGFFQCYTRYVEDTYGFIKAVKPNFDDIVHICVSPDYLFPDNAESFVRRAVETAFSQVTEIHSLTWPEPKL